MTAFTTIPASTISFNDLQTDEGTPDVATLHLKVSDDSDVTWCGQIDDRSTNCEATFTISASPPMNNPITINSFAGTMRGSLSGTHRDDTLQLYAKITNTAGTVDLISEELYFDASTLPGSATDSGTITHTVLVSDAAQWADNRLVLRWFYSKSKGSDGIYIVLYDLDFGGDYSGATALETTPGLDSVGEVDKQGVEQIFALDTTPGLATDTAIEKQPISHTHLVDGYDLLSPTSIKAGAALKTHVLECLNVGQANEVTSGGIQTTHNVGSRNIDTLGFVKAAAAIQDYQLSVVGSSVMDTRNYIKAASMVTYVGYHYGPVLITIPGHILERQHLSHVTEIQAGAVATQHDTLTARDLNAAGLIQPAALVTQTHMLAADATASTGDIQQAALVDQRHLLAARDIDTSGSLTAGALVDQVHLLATRDLTQVNDISAGELELLVVVPEFPDRTNYIDDVIDVDFSIGWSSHDPDGFTATGLPPSLTISPQGRVTGTLTSIGVYTTRIYNSTFFSEFTWNVIARPTPVTGEIHQQAINISISIAIGSTI